MEAPSYPTSGSSRLPTVLTSNTGQFPPSLSSLTDQITNWNSFRNHFSRVTVSLGDHNVKVFDEANNVFRKVLRIVRFPSYDKDYLDGDLGYRLPCSFSSTILDFSLGEADCFGLGGGGYFILSVYTRTDLDLGFFGLSWANLFSIRSLIRLSSVMVAVSALLFLKP